MYIIIIIMMIIMRESRRRRRHEKRLKIKWHIGVCDVISHATRTQKGPERGSVVFSKRLYFFSILFSKKINYHYYFLFYFVFIITVPFNGGRWWFPDELLVIVCYDFVTFVFWILQKCCLFVYLLFFKVRLWDTMNKRIRLWINNLA